VFRKVELTGDYIQEARTAIDTQFNRPYVSLNFDSKGAQLFGDLSANNVGKRMAIMLDDTVKSAPVFNEAIPGGRAQITMGGMQSYNEILRDSEDLVIVLRHGALPAPIEKQFETVVGPSLGQDSIDSSIVAFSVGGLLVVLFMLGYYRMSGVYSVLALGLNVLMIVAGLATIGATLTLPGIAGIILTIGMAVDANIIIYERIREELSLGRTPREAVNAGFEKALSAVMDSNITTGIAGLVLLQYGTGPIRGFAVTLLLGILSTIFAAVFFTRLMFDSKIPAHATDKISI
jgi:preprotein translocase subunit SecD